MSDDLRPGVLFDVDGTLLDTNYLHVLAWWQALRDAGHHGVSMAAIHRAVGIASEGLVTHLLGREDPAAVEAHSRRYAALRDQVTAFPGTADLVQACRERGLTLVLATSGKKDDLDWMLPAIGVEEGFAGATTSSDVDAGKPSPDLLTTAVKQYRLDPERTAVVGDTVWDVRAAERAGLRCVALTCGGISAAELTDAGAVEVYGGPAGLMHALDRSLLGRLVG